ncbi:OLC1v1028980C1 [Oldenlandia corymbosa var. corymbosa]|uniref:OLC1v1028980C1 n=1 Tax=Oldenlandia corymbosa var. corymbosa TaxID=529605 RepID=A0AAV1CD15_OLDCO|nr:OLC1v1028980C1 [Oldenlandia corymbosa var. corymbosa]
MIPDDLIPEILTRLPSKSLMRFNLRRDGGNDILPDYTFDCDNKEGISLTNFTGNNYSSSLINSLLVTWVSIPSTKSTNYSRYVAILTIGVDSS